MNSPTLHLYTGPFYRVIWPVRKENDLQSCRSRNRTRAIQLELALFRAPYPLNHRSFLQQSFSRIAENVHLVCTLLAHFPAFCTPIAGFEYVTNCHLKAILPAVECQIIRAIRNCNSCKMVPKRGIFWKKLTSNPLHIADGGPKKWRKAAI